MKCKRPLRVAIVGAGPAGLYAAGHLLEGPGGTYLDGCLVKLTEHAIEVDLFDRLATPWGLVRHGVAPDHPEKKLVHTAFDAIAQRSGFRFFGNIEVGRDVGPKELSQWYDAVIYAVGAPGDMHMGIEGEQLPGCWSAREFVAWYNGHPDYRELDIDLSCERAIVVGNGNVALDVARILTLPPEELERTDIAAHALAVLRVSKIREVVIVSRRGHQHGAFNNPELEELGGLHGVDILVEGGDLPGEHETMLDGADAATLRKVATLRRYAERKPAGHPRRIVLRFLTSPLELLGEGRVERLLVSRNNLERDDNGRLRARATSEESLIQAGLVLRAIGYFGAPMPGLPFDDHKGVIPNRDGRVLDKGRSQPGTYVTGWIKRGPRGIIGTNKKCARDTVRALLSDVESGTLAVSGVKDAAAVERELQRRQPQLVNHAGWLRIDDFERRSGRLSGRPRVKLTHTDELLRVALDAD